MKKMKAVLFARVSTREQAEEGYSLSAQIRLLKDYAQKNNFVIAKQFIVPESASGKQERKIFNQLLEYLTSNPTVKIQLWEKVDRSARNFKDSVKLDDWLSEDEERQIHFVKQSLIMHANSKSHEKFMWDIYVATARQYSNNLSEETRKGLYEKASQGHYPGNHKRGYRSSGDIGHKVWLVENEKPDAKYIEMAFVLYDTGNYTLRTLAKELFEQGWKLNGKQVSISELHKLLIDPFYCGEFVWKGKLYKNAKHPPLVTQELFYSVQDRLQRKIKAGKYRKHAFLLGEVCSCVMSVVTLLLPNSKKDIITTIALKEIWIVPNENMSGRRHYFNRFLKPSISSRLTMQDYLSGLERHLKKVIRMRINTTRTQSKN